MRTLSAEGLKLAEERSACCVICGQLCDDKQGLPKRQGITE